MSAVFKIVSGKEYAKAVALEGAKVQFTEACFHCFGDNTITGVYLRDHSTGAHVILLPAYAVEEFLNEENKK